MTSDESTTDFLGCMYTASFSIFLHYCTNQATESMSGECQKREQRRKRS